MLSLILAAVIASSLSTATMQTQAVQAGERTSVVAYDDKGEHSDNGKHKGENKHSVDEDQDQDEQGDSDSDFHRRWNNLRGCVVGAQSGYALALQTRLGLITVEPTGGALRAFNGGAFNVGRIVVAHGHFAGNGVYVADRINAAGNAQGGACPYQTNQFPQPTNVAPGTVNATGTIVSVGGNSLQLNTGNGTRTVYFSNSTLVEYSNGGVVGTQNLAPGESVTVYGQPSANGNGTINAGTIVIQSGLTTQNAVITGLATSVDLGNSRLTVYSGLFKATTVLLTPQTVVRRLGSIVDRSQLHSGELVTVSGSNTNGLFTAYSISINN